MRNIINNHIRHTNQTGNFCILDSLLCSGLDKDGFAFPALRQVATPVMTWRISFSCRLDADRRILCLACSVYGNFFEIGPPILVTWASEPKDVVCVVQFLRPTKRSGSASKQERHCFLYQNNCSSCPSKKGRKILIQRISWSWRNAEICCCLCGRNGYLYW
jgi:hypothetical protein